MLLNTSSSPMIWHFPLSRPHTGVPLGNARQGLLIWGQSSLRLTVAHAGFWDHRNPQNIPTGTTFQHLRNALETDDSTKLSTLFSKRPANGVFPQQFSAGRLELTFADGLRPIEAQLNLNTAVVTVKIGRNENDTSFHYIHVRQASAEEICWLDIDPALLPKLSIQLFPAYDLVRDNAMASCGIAAPETWQEANGHAAGFLQTLPEDAPLATAWTQQGTLLVLATALGENARHDVSQKILAFDPETEEVKRLEFWHQLWTHSARLTLPDATLQQQFDFGLYKQAGLIRCGTPAATLQGPWMEDTTIPPWSNDYHFNINVQLVYSAALATGHEKEMLPLWDMLRSWLPKLRELGERFYQKPGAMMLPHSVDDRGQNIGGMWSGTIDQACIAWMGQLAWQHYLFTGDLEFLRDLAWPLLKGAFLGYSAMLEETIDSTGLKHYALPISVSPEFGGADSKKCWGRDASFQLAALHSTIQILQKAAPLLGRPLEPLWADVSAHLPPYTLADADDGSYGWIGLPAKRIALWQGKDLPESHRHHSHLASIFPFCTINPFSPEHQKIVARSLNHWNKLGAGNWTGWCVPWASMICSRCGLPDAALSWLHLLAKNFTNEGHATLHNADGAGVFAWDDGSLAWPDHHKGADFLYYEIMQMDAAMGAVSAILEMIVSFRQDTITITDRLPKGWRNLAFTKIRIEGGFILSGSFRHGKAEELSIHSVRGSELRLSHALSANWTLDGETHAETLLILNTTAGKTYQLKRVH